VLPRRAVLASVEASAQRLGESGRWLLALPSSYIAGVQVIVRSLVAGHEPIVVDGLDVGRAAASDHSTTPAFVSLVPTQLHRIMGNPDQLAALARCHTVLVGGAGLDHEQRRRAEEAGVTVVATYGSSETAGGCVYDGRPLDGVAVTLGEEGRVRIAGPTMFSHYENDPELTAQSVVDGWFLTSDEGRFADDGRLEILGRIDDVVISGGVKIPLSTVAERMRQHLQVEQAEVFGVHDVEWGQKLVAVVVGTANDAELRDWISMVHPRSWAPREFVRATSLPLLANGKVDRRAIQAGL
jgi:O-succinylbenzoic acid--CoA ligase